MAEKISKQQFNLTQQEGTSRYESRSLITKYVHKTKNPTHHPHTHNDSDCVSHSARSLAWGYSSVSGIRLPTMPQTLADNKVYFENVMVPMPLKTLKIHFPKAMIVIS